MNLYIWGNSGCVRYGADSLIVMAPDLETARRLAKEAVDWSFGREHREPITRDVSGPPDKVVKNKPYAAYFMVCE